MRGPAQISALIFMNKLCYLHNVFPILVLLGLSLLFCPAIPWGRRRSSRSVLPLRTSLEVEMVVTISEIGCLVISLSGVFCFRFPQPPVKRIKLSQVKYEHFIPLEAEYQGFAREINPRTYTQIDTPTVVQGGADGTPS